MTFRVGSSGRRTVEGWVLGQGLRVTGTGILIGLGGAIGASKLVTGLVYQITPVDPLTYFGSTVFVLLVAAAACFVPARRAGKADVVEVIKSD